METGDKGKDEYKDSGMNEDDPFKGFKMEELEESEPLKIADELLFGDKDTKINDAAINNYIPELADYN